MVEPHESSIADPLLRPDRAPRDARGRPIRAPLGNSIRTLLLLGLLVAVGVAVWWLRRPSDLTMQLGGREWTIVEVDGEPAVNEIGTVSTFALDGTGEVRGLVECNVASGSWSYDTPARRLELSWETQTLLACDDDGPTTYTPSGGRVRLDDGRLRIDSEAVDITAIALADHEPVAAGALAGSWMSGGREVEIGERGRFDVGPCRGTWEAEPGDPTAFVVDFDGADPAGEECQLDAAWRSESPFVAIEHDGTVFLRQGRAAFPLDRSILRLDPAEDPAGTPIAP